MDSTFYYPEQTANLTSTCSTTPVLAVNTYGIKVSPNPIGQQQLNISLGTLIMNKAVVKVYTQNGQLIQNVDLKNGNVATIATDSWSTGSYIVEIWNNQQKVFTQQIIK